MIVIDADAHVEESQAMFDRLIKSITAAGRYRYGSTATRFSENTMPYGSSRGKPIPSWSAKAGPFSARPLSWKRLR